MMTLEIPILMKSVLSISINCLAGSLEVVITGGASLEIKVSRIVTSVYLYCLMVPTEGEKPRQQGPEASTEAKSTNVDWDQVEDYLE